MSQLPAKEQAVFRSVVKFYETKQYKKGIKAADSILKKYPEHGETLCMKGLTLSYLDKKEDAYDLVRKGLKHDLKSHVCWHVFGLLYRQDRDYKEAVKCYRQALRIDPENIQILRDLSLLQIHRRELSGFVETRRKLLQVKPSARLNWVGYAISEHLCKNFEVAWKSLDNYEKTFKDEATTDYENSELFLYKAAIMEEAGELENALECLITHEKQICDKLGLIEIKSRLFMFLGRYEEAAEGYRKLLRTNPEHHFYILGLMANKPEFHRFWPALPPPKVGPKDASGDGDSDDESVPPTICSFPQSVHPEGMPITGWLPPTHALRSQRRVAIGRRQHKRRMDTYSPAAPLTDDDEVKINEFFDELQKEHPKSDSIERVALYFLSGDRFLTRLDKYLRPRLRKGIPSLFRMVRPLYFQEGKAALIEKLLAQYVKSLTEEPSWYGAPWGETDEAAARAAASEEPPSSLLFAYMVTAEHFDFIGETQKALEVVEKAIEHTPTFVEIYSCKARIYKHAGDIETSSKCFEETRQMDLADRFLNTQSVRALLRVDNIKEGLEKVLLFSKEPDAPEAANLHDMQCMWYESAVGRSYGRQGNYGKALKEYNETFKHFSDIAEDQFDFHNYCLRKTTLKTYVAMLRMQERLYSHKFYRRAAKDAIRIYLELYDKKQRGEDDKEDKENGEEDEANLSAADRKKAKHAKMRAKKKEADAATPAAADGKKTGKKVDEDPDGKKLLEKDSMEEAVKLVKTLVQYSSDDRPTHELTYNVFSRQGRWLHCLQALIKLHSLGSGDVTHYKLIVPLAHFCFVADLESEAVPASVREVVLAEMAQLLKGSKDASPFADVKALKKEATAAIDRVEKRLKEQTDLPFIEVLNGLKCLQHAGRSTKGFMESWSPQGPISLKDSTKMLKFVAAQCGEDSNIFAKLSAHCKSVFPLMDTKIDKSA